MMHFHLLSKFNMEPDDGFQKESPFPGADFQVNDVKLQRCINFTICMAKGNLFHSQNDRNNWII